jgi:hypothetical protein
MIKNIKMYALAFNSKEKITNRSESIRYRWLFWTNF